MKQSAGVVTRTRQLVLILGVLVFASARSAQNESLFEHECDELVKHEHGLLCNAGFSASDRGVEINAGRALLWFARGTEIVHRMWLTDGVTVSFAGRNGSLAKGAARQAEYRMSEREIAFLGAATLDVNGETVTGERVEYSIPLGRVLGGE